MGIDDARCELLVVKSKLNPPDVSLRAPDGDTSAKTIITKAGFQAGDIVELRLLRRLSDERETGIRGDITPVPMKDWLEVESTCSFCEQVFLGSPKHGNLINLDTDEHLCGKCRWNALAWAAKKYLEEGRV